MAIEYTTVAAVFRKAGIDSTVVSEPDIEDFILEAEGWIDTHLQTTFKAGGRIVTETFDGDHTNVIILRRVGKEWIDADPILTVNTLTVDGVSITPSTLHVYPAIGRIVLGEDSEENFFASSQPRQNIINYTYGHTSVPRIISQLAAIIAAMEALVQQTGGTFDDVTSYSFPEFSASKGEPFTNIRETVLRLDNKSKGILAGPGMLPVSQMA